MENVSKALIIAGAILLSILIISLGIIVYNQAKGTVGNVNLSEQEIQVFNDKFSFYEGNNVSGTQVNTLINTVISSNNANIKDNTGMYITVFYPIDGRNNSQAFSYFGCFLNQEGVLSQVYSKTVYSWPKANDEIMASSGSFFGGGKVPWKHEVSEQPFNKIDIKSSLKYQVMMVKNENTGLIGQIFIGKSNVEYEFAWE